MTIQAWVISKLLEDRHVVEGIGDYGVRVVRFGRPDALAYCVDPDPVHPFTVQALSEAVSELPKAGMVIVVRRIVDPDVHERARELNVCVDTFGGFRRAIREFDEISKYVHPEETYIRGRLAATRAVGSVRRRGHRAWQIERINGLRPLVIVTHDRYELTDESFAQILNEYPKLDLDALVVTNPSAQGFGGRVVRSAQQARVPLLTFKAFIGRIREPWS